MFKRLGAWFGAVARLGAQPPVATSTRLTPESKPVRRVRVTAEMVDRARAKPDDTAEARIARTFKPAEPFPGVVPKGKASMAMDDATRNMNTWALQNSAFAEGLEFLGYPYLAQLTQRPEYRRPCEIMAKEMTRKWIKIIAKGDTDAEDKADKIKFIEQKLEELNAQRAFRELIEQDGFFGRSHLFIDLELLEEDLNKPLSLSADFIEKGKGIKNLQVIEPLWVYPNNYNSNNPLKKNFYKPQTWWVLGSEVHASRLVTIVSRQVPDMLKPAYSFGGLSLSQICKPYVDNWLRTRQSVSDLIHSFSVSVLSTDMSQMLEHGATTDLFNRLALFGTLRDNRNVLALDKDSESFENIAAPLGTLDHLQAQSQEHMSAVTGIPLVVLLGITPSGLNASSDGEIRIFYGWIEAQQEAVIRDPLKKIISIIQLAQYGEVDPSITFQFVPLYTLDETAAATVEKTKADTDAVLIDAGVIDTHEARVRLATEENSPYASLDLKIVPAMPDDGGGEQPPGLGGDPGADPGDPEPAMPDGSGLPKPPTPPAAHAPTIPAA